MATDFTPLLMERDDVGRRVSTWRDYYDALWEGFVEVGQAPERPVFSEREKAELSATYAARGGDIGRGGRGLISITLDDALAVHFSDVLPLTRQMNFPIGTAWHTDNGRDALVAEAHAAGWEVMSHLPDNIPATSVTEAELISMAESSRAKIAAITGRSDDIAFVYPQHLRNDTTDRILSRYYTWGRGRATSKPVSNKGGHPWLVSALYLDDKHDSAGNLTAQLKRDLRAAARNDSRIATYGHYDGTIPGRLEMLVNLVNYARSLGMQVVRPSDIRNSEYVAPRGMVASDWTLGTNATISTEQVIRPGDASIKITPNASGGAALISPQRMVTAAGVPVGPNKGAFTVYRVSVRYKASADVPISAGWGVTLGATLYSPDVNGGDEVGHTGSTSWAPYFPASGTVIPAADWGLISFLVAVGPDVSSAVPALSAANVLAGGVPIYFADLKWDHLDTASSLSYAVNLNGTTGTTLRTNVLGVGEYGVTITPKSAVAGRLYYTVPSASGHELSIKSTDAADTGAVQVTIHPGKGYKTHTLTGTGA